MYRLRNRLIAAFLVATVLPLGATIWVASALLDRSLGYATTDELDRLSRTLEDTVRQFYQRERETLRRDADAGMASSEHLAAARQADWPDAVQEFWRSAEADRFVLAGEGGSRLEYLKRTADGVEVFRRDLDGIRLEAVSADFANTRDLIQSLEARDLRRGFTLTLLLLAAGVWLVSLVPLMFIAHRVSRPIQDLTAGLSRFAAGEMDHRIATDRHDEVGAAVAAFNHMADEHQRSQERLVYLTQMASWQSLARKTAHELKNSLTPIRLTVEEMLARQPSADRAFMEQATQIVVGEIETLERRVRAFSDFSSEPPVHPEPLDLHGLLTERIALLGPAHPGIDYRLALDPGARTIFASADLVKGILTNVLENAADAAGPSGAVLTVTRAEEDVVQVDIHDSGPGVAAEAASTLFAPSITFKKDGMGLGLSIARKHALLSGGDVELIDGLLGGAGFRVTLPAHPPAHAA